MINLCYQGNFAYQRWAVKNDDTTYFERQSNSTWIEFHNEEFHTVLAEIRQNYQSNGGLVVILKNDEGKFVKLTNEAYFSDEDENIITDLISNGTWTDDGMSKFDKSEKNFKKLRKNCLNINFLF